MASLFSYVIDHNNDPKYKNGFLTLGQNTCKWRIRNVAIKGDWIIARPNSNFLKGDEKNFPKKVIKQHENDFGECLAYSMQVFDKNILNRMASKNPKDKKYILLSKNFWVFNKLIKVPKKFKSLIDVGENHKRFPLDDPLVKIFLVWLTKQPKEAPFLFGKVKTSCRKSKKCSATK